MNLTDEQVAHEVAQIEDEDQWPRWPWLPMKNVNRYDAKWSGENGGLGMLLSPRLAKDTGRPLRILFVNMLNLSAALEPGSNVSAQEFESVEDMVRAGWIGD